MRAKTAPARVLGRLATISTVLPVALACVLAIGRGPARAANPLPSTINAVVIGISSSIWPAIVADEKGFFAEQGIQVKMISSGSSARSLQQVAAGVADIGSSSMVDTFRAIDGGADVKIFLNSQAVGTHSLIAAKGITSIAGLKGRRVITGGQKDITNLWWYAMARHFGLDPSKDVQLLFSGSTSNRFAALLAGGVEAAVLSPPQSFKAIQEGYTDLGPVAPYMGDFPMMIWHVNTKWAATHGTQLIAFAAAHDKAVRYMLDATHKTEVSEMLAKAANSSLADVLETWDLSVKVKAYVPDGSFSPRTLGHVSDVLLANGDLKTPVKPPSAFYDDRYMRAASQ